MSTEEALRRYLDKKLAKTTTPRLCPICWDNEHPMGELFPKDAHESWCQPDCVDEQDRRDKAETSDATRKSFEDEGGPG